MEGKSKQEDHQSKSAREIYNFHHGGDNGVNAYGGINYGNGNFTPRDILELTSNEDSCDIMNEKIIEKKESIKIKEKERVENKERLVERLCIFDSISILSKEGEPSECSKEKESELEKGVEDKGRSMEKELGTILEELPISLSLYLSLMDFEVMNDASIESIVVGFGLDGVLFDILHDKCFGKFVENVDYVSSFLDTFMENHNDFFSLNQLMPFVSGQVEFSCNVQMSMTP
ncbi:hypothetical protein M9H77_22738 [Catharanthus roseus]|uniref:Uncharacterized protein n=1 Tax=Catharanthus roseus TaxID=4058 RepID=A0ACC0ARB1_CATRO|nr:hypothetical protein M9H77_22738 [Catharanthus roseus]